MKQLSKSHQELLDTYFPKGYTVSEKEAGHYHIMFVDKRIVNKDVIKNIVIQKYYPGEWSRMKAAIEHPAIGILQTGHDEYCVIYDPVEAKAKKEAADARAAEKEAKAEDEQPKQGTGGTRPKSNIKPKSNVATKE